MSRLLLKYEVAIAIFATVLVYVIHYSYPPYELPIFLSLSIYLMAMCYAGIFMLPRTIEEMKSKSPRYITRLFLRLGLFGLIMSANIIRTNIH